MNDPAFFVCSECARPGPDASDCPCGAGARLDLRDPEVVSMLVLEDDRRLERATQRNLWVGVGVGVAAIVGLLFVAPQIITAIPLPVPFANPIKVAGLAILLAAGTWKGLGAAVPARRRFPDLKAVASARSPEFERMRKTSKSTWIAIAAGAGLLVAAGVAISFVERQETGASNGALPGPRGGREVPAEATPPALFRDADFPVLHPGILSLRGKVELTGGSFALLYRAPAGQLVACEVSPDAAPFVACSEPRIPVKPQSAQLVRGRAEIWISGITGMVEASEEPTDPASKKRPKNKKEKPDAKNEKPDAPPAMEIQRGVFTIGGEKIEEKLESLDLAPDRPTLPPPSKTWYRGTLGEAALDLTRAESGELRLVVGSDEPLKVLDDPERGGPATGTPITFVGKQAVVVLFQSKKGLGALRLTAAGEVEPVR
jgi:hypothetical protein